MVLSKSRKAFRSAARAVLVVFPLVYLAIELPIRFSLKLVDKADSYIFRKDDRNQPRSL
jgi:hypothetical protein